MRVSGQLTILTADPRTGAAEISGSFAASDAQRTRWPLSRLRTELGEDGAWLADLEAQARALDEGSPHPMSLTWTIADNAATLVESVPQPLAPAPFVRAIVDRAESERISQRDALLAITPDQLLLAGDVSLRCDPSTLLARGLPASPGAVSGPLALDTRDVVEGCIWVVSDLGAEDAPLLTKASGVVATSGGLTSDAAIMARALRKPCAVSTPLRIEDHAAGTVVSLDGGTGELHRGALPVQWSPAHSQAETLRVWAVTHAGGPLAEGASPHEALTAARDALRGAAQATTKK